MQRDDLAERSWLLRGARVAVGPEEAQRLDVAVLGGRISSLQDSGSAPQNAGGREILLDGCLLLPGLVNAHDHLEFSLFPRLGQGPFPNAREWAAQIYQPDAPPIRQQLQIPKPDRLIWGGLKNLLSGVTTVCHHNPYEPDVFDCGFPVRVVRKFGWAHSLDFSDDVKDRFADTPSDTPFVLHLGEATDDAGRRQIFELDAMGALDHRTVVVHAVALDADGLALVERRGAALIWCPSSNLFTLGATLDTAAFASGIRLALGTDSALTGEGDLLDELQVAHRLGRAGASRLWKMVTTEAAAVLRLQRGEGRLTEGGLADVVAIRDRGGTPCDALRGASVAEPVLVMVGGDIKLVAEDFADRLERSITGRLHRIKTAGRRACLVDADVPALVASARGASGSQQPLCLAGKAVED